MSKKRGGYDVRSDVRTSKKRCDRCGKTGFFRPRERRCKRSVQKGFGNLGALYYCYGHLTPVALKIKVIRAESGEDQQAAAYISKYRAKATKALTKAREMVAKRQTRIKRLQTSTRKWQRKVRTLERRAVLTDAQIQAERARMVRAAQVRAVRHRLLKSAGVDPAGL